jgi:hypothetical protein
MPSTADQGGLNPDKLLLDLNSRTRTGKLEDSEAVEIAHRFNMLCDWIGMGGRLPASWARGQRLGPYAQPFRQELDISEGEAGYPVISCASCAAPLLTNGTMTHAFSCEYVP